MTRKADESTRNGVVQSGTTQIAFTSRGHGLSVLLVCLGDAEPELVAALARRSRVIAPRLSPAPTDSEFAHWLAVLIDGLGLVQPRAVFVGDACVFANVARNETDRVACVETVAAMPHRDEMLALVERLGL